MFHDELYVSLCKKMYGWKKHQMDVVNLAVGGSHIDYGINPEYFDDDTYNIGVASLDLFGIFYLLKNISRSAPKLKNVIMALTIYSPGCKLSKTSERYRCIYYRKFFDIPYNVCSIHRMWRKIKKSEAINVSWDYRGYDSQKSALDTDALTRTRGHLKLIMRGDSQIKYFKKIVKLCRRRGWNLVAYISPVRDDYRQYIHPFFIERLIKYTEKSGVIVKNFFADKNFVSTDFVDTDHLSQLGGIKLSKIINKIIKE